MRTQTYLKIEEADFFLKKLKRNYNKKKLFRFYLSAFLSSARSVVWIFRVEFIKTKGFAEWYEKRQATKEEAELFKKISELRNSSTHKKPNDPRWYVSAIFTVPKDFNYANLKDKNMRISISKADKDGNQELSFTSEDGSELVGAISDYRILTSLEEKEDLYSSCKRYLEILRKIYNEWMIFSGQGIDGQ